MGKLRMANVGQLREYLSCFMSGLKIKPLLDIEYKWIDGKSEAYLEVTLPGIPSDQGEKEVSDGE